MDIREDLNNHEKFKTLSTFIMELRDKLWREDKIRIEGYTYSEWKKEQESRVS